MKETTCHDCGCKEGEIHDYGCDMERCPFCGGQLISCDCCYKKLGYNYNSDAPYSGLPKNVYCNGISDEERERWIKILTKKGRIPYLQCAFFCEYCGEKYPNMFTVPDEEWEKYVIPELQRKVLCVDCYEKMKVLFPKGWRKK